MSDLIKFQRKVDDLTYESRSQNIAPRRITLNRINYDRLAEAAKEFAEIVKCDIATFDETQNLTTYSGLPVEIDENLRDDQVVVGW